MSPDVAIEESKLKVTRSEKALEAMGDSSGADWIVCRGHSFAKAREAAWERPLEVQIKECRKFISRAEHRVAKLEADVVAEKTMLEEGRARLSRLEAVAGSSSSSPTKSGGRVGATDHRIGAGARCIPSRCLLNEEEKSSEPQTSTQSSQEAFDVLMTRAMQDAPWRKMCCQRARKVWQNG